MIIKIYTSHDNTNISHDHTNISHDHTNISHDRTNISHDHILVWNNVLYTMLVILIETYCT